MTHIIIYGLRHNVLYATMEDARKGIPMTYTTPAVGTALTEIISKMSVKPRKPDIVILHITPWSEEGSVNRYLEQDTKKGIIALAMLRSHRTQERWLRFNLADYDRRDLTRLSSLPKVAWICNRTWKQVMTPDDKDHNYYCLRVHFPKKSRRKRS